MKHNNDSPSELSGIELRLSYQGPPVIEGLTIDLPIGQITVIVGPNGCGKSTLLRAFARVLTPDSGKVILNGVDITSLDEERRAELRGYMVGFVFQSFQLLFHHLCYEKYNV